MIFQSETANDNLSVTSVLGWRLAFPERPEQAQDNNTRRSTWER
jgi:hypothetical protein